ncbi:E3 ubiquitin-protein ligase TRIM56-like [Ptychodera flava]|uniref:E3 ubiquitin-protein ligase TRIM56-like n=1 Tax=Ptychodera flava TaxID=63121 RepID=UPI00396A809C
MAAGNDEKSFLEKIDENFLICSICSERYIKAKCLPCLHTFCEPCLGQVLKKTGKLDCPICRRTCAVPRGGVGMLQNNFFINDLVEQFKLREGGKSELSTKCGGCQENEGDEVRCIECDVNLCSTCARPHRRVPATRSHRLMPLTAYKEAKSVHPASVTVPMQCGTHQANKLDYFCVTCDEVICRECTVIDHKAPEHKHQYLKESAKIYAKELDKLLTNLNGKEQEVNESINNVDKTIRSLEKRFDQEKRKLSIHIEDIIHHVQSIGTQITEEMKYELESRKTNLHRQMKELQCIENDLTSTRDYVQNISHFGSPAQLMTAKKGISSQAQELTKLETKVQPVDSDYIEFEKADDFIEIGAASIGNVHGLAAFPNVNKTSELTRSQLDVSTTPEAHDHQSTPVFTSAEEVSGAIARLRDGEEEMQGRSTISAQWQMKLRFHQCNQGNVVFSFDRKSAITFGNRAVVFGHRSVVLGEKISLRVRDEDISVCYPSSRITSVGFTSKCPDDIPTSYLEELVTGPSHIQTLQDFWLKCIYGNIDIIRFWVQKEGHMLIALDSDDATVQRTDIDTSKPLWFVIVCSKNTRTEIL